MYTFRLLHVSDLHVAVRPRLAGFPDWKSLPDFPGGTRGFLAPSSYDPFLMAGVARWLFRNPNRYDAIVVTGDLAATGDPADLDRAYDYLFAPPLPAAYWSFQDRPTFQAGQAPVCILPGNHDRFDGWNLWPGGSQFDKIFKRNGQGWTAGQGAQSLVVLQAPEGSEKLAVVAADFSLASLWDSWGTWGYLGQGRVYASILMKLQAATLQVRQTHKPIGVVWAVHFPPAFAGIDRNLRLLNDHLLLAQAAALGIEHLFCGHTHEARTYELTDPRTGNRVRVHCAGTATQYVTDHGNVVHDAETVVNGGRVVAVNSTNVVWDEAAADFAPC